MATRHVVLVAYPGVQTLDVAGPFEVFASANRYCTPGRPGYAVELASPRGGTVRGASGLCLAGTTPLARVRGPIDTLLVAGGTEEALREVADRGGLPAWLRRRSPRVRRVGSVCTGAFVLAAAGLLAGRRVATHWGACDALAERCPDATVERDALFVVDPPLYTSAGVSAAIDLTLALVEEDLGPPVALAVARDLVLFLRRPGGQSQFSAGLLAQTEANDRLHDLLAWIQDHPEADLSVEALARRMAMSPRNFSRVFRHETGSTPAQFAMAVRIERAKLYLEDSDWSIARIAERAGFGSDDALQRAFRRRLGVRPSDYRARFARRALAGGSKARRG